MNTNNIRLFAVLITLMTWASVSAAFGVLNNLPGEVFEVDKMLFYINPNDQKCSLIDFFYIESEADKGYDNTIWGNYTNNPDMLKWYDIIDYSGDIAIPSEVEHNGEKYEVYEVRCWITGRFNTKETKSLIIPGTVKRIRGFMKGNFDYIEIQEGTEFIAGFNNLALKELRLPSSVATLMRYSFVNITGLEEFTFPPLIEIAQSCILMQCYDLKVLHMNNVRNVSGNVGCKLPKLTTLDLGLVTEIEGNSFFELHSLEELTIPETMQKIGSNCFSDMPKLKKLTLPSHPVEIDHSFNTTGVREIYARSREPYDLNGSFSGSDKGLITVYVPKGAKEAYMAHPDWAALGEIVEDAASVDEIAVDSFEVRGTDGELEITLSSAAEVVIYAADGKVAAKKVIDGTEIINLAPGLYIAKCGQQSKKVIVK